MILKILLVVVLLLAAKDTLEHEMTKIFGGGID